MRPILDALDRAFVSIDQRSRDLLRRVDFRDVSAASSGASLVVRSAAIVEMTFGGITTKLWDDPFEWTLPEHLSDREAVLRYLDEVEATRQTGFDYFQSDADLSREIPAPKKLKPLIDVLLEALARAEHHLGRADEAIKSIHRESPLRNVDPS